MAVSVDSEARPSSRQIVRVISNLPRFDGIATDRYQIANRYHQKGDTVLGGASLFFQSYGHEVVVWSSGTRGLLIYCCLRCLLPGNTCKLVAVDCILPRPDSRWQAWVARTKGLLLKQVDRFILHFKETSVYQAAYNIPADRCSYVPFKINYAESVSAMESRQNSEGYVFTAGRSFRDLPTFIEAMRLVGYPGLVLYEAASVMRKAGSEIDLASLPPHLLAKDNSEGKNWVDDIAGAKIVVVPLIPTSGYAPGLSLYLMAMAMKKCVIITEGAATRGLLSGDEAILVRPSDPEALANAIKMAWENDAFRENIAKGGYLYAQKLGGESRLLGDIAKICGDVLSA